MASNTESEKWLWMAMEPELTEREKQLRNLFVDEYLVDYEPVAAAQRCGFQSSFAKDYAIKFMQESYVQKRIKEIEHAKIDESQTEQYNKQRVIAVLIKEAHNPFTSGSARVAAASKLASIYGMDKQPEKAPEGGHRGGVLVVPGVASLDDWEAAAVASQTKLVADARN